MAIDTLAKAGIGIHSLSSTDADMAHGFDGPVWDVMDIQRAWPATPPVPPAPPAVG